MTRHIPSTHPFKLMEEEAYHAFLEWPVWLALREKELAAHLAAPRAPAEPRAEQSTHDPHGHEERARQ